jgi:hypothetical protein
MVGSGLGGYGLGGSLGSGLSGYGSYYVVGNEFVGSGTQMMNTPCVPVISCVPVVTQAVSQPVRYKLLFYLFIQFYLT